MKKAQLAILAVLEYKQGYAPTKNPPLSERRINIFAQNLTIRL
jgi:hypothetical protein